MRKMDNDVSHGFDLQMFLTANDIQNDGKFVFSDNIIILFRATATFLTDSQ